MKISLYEMTEDLLGLMEIPEEEITPEERTEIMEHLMDLIKNKSENTLKYLINMETRIKASKDEEKRIKAYRQSQEKKYERLKQYLVECLTKADVKEIETNIGKVSLRKAPASVEVDENLLPKKYMVKKTTVAPDKTLLKELLKDGKNIKGARLVEDKYNLSVK